MLATRVRWCSLLGLLLCAGMVRAQAVQYESPHVHPINLGGDRMAVVNTPDSRVSFFLYAGDGFNLISEVKVGLEPISVRQAGNGLYWVVNHLSDSISIVDASTASVIETLPVGDEPTDIAFLDHPILDDGSQVAAVTLSQEDRVIFCEAFPPYTLLGAVDLNGAEPRAMAVDVDGMSVWVALFESGSNTSIVQRQLVADVNGPWGGSLPPFDPPLNPNLPAGLMPTNATIAVKDDMGDWVDEQGGVWTNQIPWDLYDVDLVRISINSGVPVVTDEITSVSTLMEDLIVDPANGDLFVLNVDSHNEILFEPKLKGLFATNQLSILRDGTNSAVHTNLNREDNVLPVPKRALAFELYQHVPKTQAIAYPTDVALVERDSKRRLYISSIGSATMAVVNPANGRVVSRIQVPQGSTGVAYHAGSDQLVVSNRFDNSLHLVDPDAGATGVTMPIGKSGWNPTPPEVLKGRQFLYSGANSEHGDLACHTCHPYGNLDGIMWDLGDPSGNMIPLDPNDPNSLQFHPLKGPMVTQTLRGLFDTEPFHWRGDRADFGAFNPAFASLLGGSQISTGEMDDYEAFIHSMKYPPNPFRDLTDAPQSVVGGDPLVGENIFLTLNNGFCNNCHDTAVHGTNQQVMFLGSSLGNQPFKVAQLRNMYEKTGFDDLFGPNKRATGFLHDGAAPNMAFFLTFIINNIQVPPANKLDVEDYLMSFPTETHPATGATVTMTQANFNSPGMQIYEDLVAASSLGVVDLIASGTLNGEVRGFVHTGYGWDSDRFGDVWTEQSLFAAIQGGAAEISYMGVPLGEGVRMGIDRDLDGSRDRDELDQGTDPADPSEIATGIGFEGGRQETLSRVTTIFPAPFTSRTSVEVYLSTPSRVELAVFDVRGRKIRSLAGGTLPNGRHSFIWDGRDSRGQSVASGAYFVRLASADRQHARKVVKLD